jgi:hypothetical protein
MDGRKCENVVLRTVPDVNYYYYYTLDSIIMLLIV